MLSGFERLRHSQRSRQIPQSSCPRGCPGLAASASGRPARRKPAPRDGRGGTLNTKHERLWLGGSPPSALSLQGLLP